MSSYILTHFWPLPMQIDELLISKTVFHYNEGPTLGRFISNFELSLQICHRRPPESSTLKRLSPRGHQKTHLKHQSEQIRYLIGLSTRTLTRLTFNVDQT